MPVPNSCGSTSQTHRRLQFYNRQSNRLEIQISFKIICMFSIVTSFSNLYFTLVTLTAFFEEEEVRGDPHQISRDYSFLNENCIYNIETTFFKTEKQMRYKTPNMSLGMKRSNSFQMLKDLLQGL